MPALTVVSNVPESEYDVRLEYAARMWEIIFSGLASSPRAEIDRQMTETNDTATTVVRDAVISFFLSHNVNLTRSKRRGLFESRAGYGCADRAASFYLDPVGEEAQVWETVAGLP